MSREQDRTPPHSEEAERGVLGCFMLEPARTVPLAMVQYSLRPDSFYVPVHRTLATALFDMAKGDVSRIDLLTVGDYLGQHNLLDQVGGSSFLERLIDDTPTASHAEHYMAIVRKKAIARGVIERSQNIHDEAYIVEDPEKLALEASQRYVDILGDVREEMTNGEAMERSIAAWTDAKAFREGDASKKPAIGLETPWPKLTNLMCGLEPGLIVVAGRPSAGKTTLEDCLAVYAADALKVPVARATLDSTKRKLWDRTLCRYAGVSLPKLKFGFAGHSQLNECSQQAVYLAQLPVFIHDGLYDIDSICAWARFMRARHNIGLFTVDYVQQITVAGSSRFLADNENARLEYISRCLKRLWRELKIPIMVLSQLSRAIEKDSKSGDRDPRMSDLRGSGALEQDADVILFCHTDLKKKAAMEETRRGATKHKRPVWFRQLKHKEAEQGDIAMWLHAPYFMFEVAESSDTDDFADDGLPGDADTTERDFDKHPDLAPQDEQQQEFGEPANHADGRE